MRVRHQFTGFEVNFCVIHLILMDIVSSVVWFGHHYWRNVIQLPIFPMWELLGHYKDALVAAALYTVSIPMVTIVAWFVQIDVLHSTCVARSLSYVFFPHFICWLGLFSPFSCCLQLNPDLTPFQRLFAGYIRRCDDLERRLRFFEQQMKQHNVSSIVRAFMCSCVTITLAGGWWSLGITFVQSSAWLVMSLRVRFYGAQACHWPM